MSLEAHSEFNEIVLLSGADMKMDAIEASPDFEMNLSNITREIEQKITDTVRPLVLNLMQKNKLHAHPALKTIRDITLEFNSKVVQYFRAGKNYVRIDHEMGAMGNLFFKSAFDNILGADNYYLLEQKNSVCIVCRI